MGSMLWRVMTVIGTVIVIVIVIVYLILWPGPDFFWGFVFLMDR